MRGRYPDSLEELLADLEGSAEDKQRVQAILETVCGSARVLHVCAKLDIGETRFRQLRTLILQGALDAIRPRPAGRPSRQAVVTAEQLRELEQVLAEKDLELHEAQVREEVALILPQRAEMETVKKGRRATVKLRKRKPR